jgi:hypothetical protein
MKIWTPNHIGKVFMNPNLGFWFDGYNFVLVNYLH